MRISGSKWLPLYKINKMKGGLQVQTTTCIHPVTQRFILRFLPVILPKDTLTRGLEKQGLQPFSAIQPALCPEPQPHNCKIKEQTKINKNRSQVLSKQSFVNILFFFLNIGDENDTLFSGGSTFQQAVKEFNLQLHKL